MPRPVCTPIPSEPAMPGQGGFSLVEVTVAAAILGLVISALAVMIGNSELLRAANDHDRQARTIAQEEMEDPVRNFLRGQAGPGESNNLIDLDHAEASAPISANRKITVTPPITEAVFRDGVDFSYQVIKTTVSWPEAGVNHEVTLSKRIVVLK